MSRIRERLEARRWALIGAVGLAVLILALAAAWRWTPLQEIAQPRVIGAWLEEAADEGWMPLVVAALYVGASLVMFPNTVLCLAVILTLGPLIGTAYAFGGSLTAALAGYSLGRWGGERIKKLQVRAVNKMSAKLRKGGGFLQVLALRTLPVAPFSATNILSGAARVRILPFMAATAIGISPYILTFAAFGRQARRLLSNPTPTDAAVALGIVVAAALAFWGAHALATRVKW
jgi:uncharacterized membrane protein YdjX (TVP38/TMEM64 family)